MQFPIEQLTQLSSLSALGIAVVFGVHLFGFFVLWIWFRHDLRSIAASLDDFTRGLTHRSILSRTAHLSDQIEAFLADVTETLEHDDRQEERGALLLRLNILDERRRYLDSLFFETCYNICRTMIEAYPLAGVLGTILAIGAALQTDSGPEGASAVSAIVARFGDAIWSTFAGLVAAIALMFVNSAVEPRFTRLSENRLHVRETVARVKRELSLQGREG